MLPGAASATQSKEFKRVKQKIEVTLAVFGNFNVVDWALLQGFGDAAINAGEMVKINERNEIAPDGIEQMKE